MEKICCNCRYWETKGGDMRECHAFSSHWDNDSSTYIEPMIDGKYVDSGDWAASDAKFHREFGCRFWESK